MSTAGGRWRAVGSQRRRRLWSGLLGAGLLVAGFHRRPKGEAPTDEPEAADGRPRRNATTKTRRAWLEIARLLYSAIGQHRVVSIAAGVTFFALLAMFPAVAALVSIYGIFADPGTIRVHLDDLSSFLPGGAIEVVGDQLSRVAAGGKSRLGATFLFTLTLSLWSANAGMKALFDALNIVYDTQERRGLIKLNAVSLCLHSWRTSAAAACHCRDCRAAGDTGVCRASIRRRIDCHGRTVAGAFAIVVVGLVITYRFGPDREHVQWRWITWGVDWPPRSGSSYRSCSPGTRKISEPTTRPMAHWALSSVS